MSKTGCVKHNRYESESTDTGLKALTSGDFEDADVMKTWMSLYSSSKQSLNKLV